MKLLIVEDEMVTRENLATMLDYGRLGFQEIITAENGISGYEKVVQYHPEVILTDIRMPRMDGIEFATRISKNFPEIRIIFLSAYAELEYYRAAIRLHTVSYIEKPVDPVRLKEILIEAAGQIRQSVLASQMEKAKELESKKKLAYVLTVRNWKTEHQSLADSVFRDEYSLCTTFLIENSVEREPEELLERLADYEKKSGGMFLAALNQENCMILHYLSNEIHYRAVSAIAKKIESIFLPGEKWYVSVGTSAAVGRSYLSYQSAVVGLQYCFFEEYGYVVMPCENMPPIIFADSYCLEQRELHALMEGGQLEKLKLAETELFEKIIKERNVSGSRIRSMYMEFLHTLIKEGERQGVSAEMLEQYRTIVWNERQDRKNCRELHGILQTFVQELLQWEQGRTENQTQIAQIRNYIEKNYQDPQFSLVEISEYVHMSVSYMCVVFKKETGKTINQYLTEFRMRKAKKYLKDMSYRMNEVAAMCGYQDVSYFGRIFKKTWQMTPAEYREGKRTET